MADNCDAIASPEHSARNCYRRRRELAEANMARLGAADVRVARLRLTVGLGLAVALFGVWRGVGLPVLAASIVLISCFAALVVIHNRIAARRSHQQALAELNRLSLARLERDWRSLPPAAAKLDGPGNFLRDLDIIGAGSLSQLLGTIATPIAWQRFFDGLLKWPRSAELVERQSAIQALAPRLDHRQRVFLAAAPLRGPGATEAQLLQWAVAPEVTELPARPLVVALTAVIPVVAAATIFGTVSVFALGVAVGAVGLVNLVYLPRIHQALEALERSSATLGRYRCLIDIVLADDCDDPYVRRLRASLGGERSASREISRLQRLVHFADIRHAGMSYIILQLLSLWSFHVFFALVMWRRRCGASVSAWMNALADYEVLASLAGLRHDHPAWCFPEVTEEPRIAAVALGHPLIREDARVGNDLELSRPGPSLLFVTGSNMSGKSTLLRALGINIVLASLGAPVCAQRMCLPPTAVCTCFNVEDALAVGRSLFMAELFCIRSALDGLETARIEGLQPVFLFDEILRGTNSADRRIAVAAILERLLAIDAIGAIATHDLQLADQQLLQMHARAVHFQESVEVVEGQPLLRFDYQLRDGLATTSNALLLLEAVGIRSPPRRDEAQ